MLWLNIELKGQKLEEFSQFYQLESGDYDRFQDNIAQTTHNKY